MDNQPRNLITSLVAISALVGAYLHFLFASARDWLYPRTCLTAELEAQIERLVKLLQSPSLQIRDQEVLVGLPWKAICVWSLLLVLTAFLYQGAFLRRSSWDSLCRDWNSPMARTTLPLTAPALEGGVEPLVPRRLLLIELAPAGQ